MGKPDFIFRYRVRNWPVYNRALVGVKLTARKTEFVEGRSSA